MNKVIMSAGQEKDMDLSTFVDAIIDDCAWAYDVRCSLTYELEECVHKLFVVFCSKRKPDMGKIEIEFISDMHNNLMATKGLNLECNNMGSSDIEIYDPDYTFSKQQIDRINTILLSSDAEYLELLLNIEEYNRFAVFERINALINSGKMRFKKVDETDYVFKLDGLRFKNKLLTYRAEYQDAVFEYSSIEDRKRLFDMAEHLSNKKDEYVYECAAPRLSVCVNNTFSCTITCLSQKEIKRLHIKKNKPNANTKKNNMNQPAAKKQTRDIDLKDVMVITSMAACNEKQHSVEKVRAFVYVINYETHKKELQEIKAYYCDSCKRYYVLEQTYKRLQSIGAICCRVYTLSELTKNHGTSWATESVLKMYGYNVSQKEGLSDLERHTVLDMIIANEIMSESRCIRFIEWLIRHNSTRANMNIAITKWNKDIDYLRNGKRPPVSDFLVRSFLTESNI